MQHVGSGATGQSRLHDYSPCPTHKASDQIEPDLMALRVYPVALASNCQSLVTFKLKMSTAFMCALTKDVVVCVSTSLCKAHRSRFFWTTSQFLQSEFELRTIAADAKVAHRRHEPTRPTKDRSTRITHQSFQPSDTVYDLRILLPPSSINYREYR